MASKRLFQIFEVSVFFAVIATQLYLSQRGLTFLLDEEWYVNEPYLLATGGVPFVDVFSNAPGFGIIPAIFYKLFMWITGGTDGLYLFSRWLYVFWNALVALLTFWVVRKFTRFRIPFLAVSAHIATVPNGAYYITYNSIGHMFLPLICALVFADHENRLGKSKIFGFFAGLVASLTVLGTPMTLIALFVLLLYLITQEKWDRITGIFWGIFTSVVLLVTYCCSLRGIKSFLNGLYIQLHWGYGNQKYMLPLNYTFQSLLFYLAPFGFTVLLLMFLKMFLKNRPKTFDTLLFLTCPFYCFCGAAVHNLFLNRNSCDPSFSWFGTLLYLIFAFHKPRLYSLAIISTIVLACLFTYLIVSLLCVSTCLSKAYWLLPLPILSFCMLYNELSCSLASKKGFFLLTLPFLIIIAIRLHKSYTFRCQHMQFPQATYRYPQGIWKNLYVTPSEGQDLLAIERYLKSVIQDSDRVLFPYFINLQTYAIKGKWSIGLDTTTEMNMPMFYYNYWSNCQHVPNKIIETFDTEIHSTRKPVFVRSASSFLTFPKWTLTKFVEKYYVLANTYQRDQIHIHVYALKDPIGAMQEAHDLATIPFKRALNHHR